MERDAPFSTRNCPPSAECNKNLSETIAKEPRAATQHLVVIFLVIYKGSRFIRKSLR